MNNKLKITWILKFVSSILLLIIFEAFLYGFVFYDFFSVSTSSSKELMLFIKTVINFSSILLFWAITKVIFKKSFKELFLYQNRILFRVLVKWTTVTFISYSIILCLRYTLADETSIHTVQLGFFLVSSVIISAFFVAFKEEIIFRGFILKWFSNIFSGKILPIISSSLLFALYHITNYGFIGLVVIFLWGILFAYIVKKGHQIEIPIAIHLGTLLSTEFFNLCFTYKVNEPLNIILEIIYILFVYLFFRFNINRKIVVTK